MPGFDGTGPFGYGPRTGGGFGFCPPGWGGQGDIGPAFPLFGAGRGGRPWGGGRGRAWGGGRGRGRWAAQAYPPEAMSPPPAYAPPAEYPDETESIRQQLAWLDQQSEALRARLEALERTQTESNNRLGPAAPPAE